MPTQTAAASTKKSLRRACRPGIINWASSMAAQKYHCPNAQQPFISKVSEAERDSVGKKYSSMLDLVRNKCGRPSARRNQRKKDNRRQRQPGHHTTNILRQHVRISVRGAGCTRGITRRLS